MTNFLFYKAGVKASYLINNLFNLYITRSQFKAGGYGD